MPIDMSKVNLDAPAFGPGSEVNNNVNAQASETATADVSQTESDDNKATATVPAEDDKGIVSEDDEQKVPYSRMKSVIDARREAERRAEEAEAELFRIQQHNESRNYRPDDTRTAAVEGDLPHWWVAMYGDNDVSKKAYGYELERQQHMRDEARREAIDAVREERQAETRVISSNERIIDTRLEDLAMGLGRDLTEKEEGAILEIVDEYTPKDERGDYAGDLLPFDKAWEIYEMKQSKSASRGATRSREAATGLTNSRSEGEPNDKERANKEWNPLDWNSYKKRIPN